MDAKRALGRRIKALRKRAALTQEGLAERAGFNPKYVSGIERGRENPTLDTLIRMAAELGVQPVELFDFDLDGATPAAMKKAAVDLMGRLDVEALRRVLRIVRAAYS
jgi:transcriptional regulator with XRE-family HTH domain